MSRYRDPIGHNSCSCTDIERIISAAYVRRKSDVHFLLDIKARVRDLIEGLFGVYVFREKFIPGGVRLDRDIKRYLPKFRAEVVFDVGANVGQSAKHFLIWFAGAQIYCFEPVESTFLELRENMKRQNHVQCCQLALGASPGRGTMVHRGPSVMFYLAGTPEKSSRITSSELEKVTIQTVDDFCRDASIEKINYLKIDAEGHDLEVLRGAEDMLREQRIDMVQVEAGMYSGNTRHVPFEVFKQYLEQRQYFIFGIYEQMHEWTENAPHLRRTNPVFISKRLLESNKNESPT